MFSVSGLFSTIILLGALQGIIIGFLLYFTSKQRQTGRLLALLIWLMALASLDIYLYNTGLFYSGTFMSVFHALVPMILVMPMGPLLYFYIQSSLDPDFRMQKKQRVQFYPVVLDILPQLAALIYIAGVLTGAIKKGIPLGYYIDVYNTYVDIPRWISLTAYIWLAGKYLKGFKRMNPAIISETAGRVKWLQQFFNFFLAFQIIWFIYLVPYVIPRYTNWMVETFYWYPVYIPLAILIYWLGIKGYLVLQSYSATRKPAGLYDQLATNIVQQTVFVLKRAMEEDKIYLNPSLNLTVLSRHTGISQKKISAVLNGHMHKSFNDYVNEYRVEEFKRKIFEPGLTHLTISGIAAECGFSSQATFQRTFKQMTGLSPSGFRENHPTSKNE